MFILQKRARMDFIHKGHAGEYIYLGDYPVKGITRVPDRPAFLADELNCHSQGDLHRATMINSVTSAVWFAVPVPATNEGLFLRLNEGLKLSRQGLIIVILGLVRRLMCG